MSPNCASTTAAATSCAYRRAWRESGLPPYSPISSPAYRRYWRPRRTRWVRKSRAAATTGRFPPTALRPDGRSSPGTHTVVDIHDLYVEKFDADTSHTRFKGEMVPTAHRAEAIGVRDGDDVAVNVIETHHGPVIAGDPRKGTALALKSVQFAVPDASFNCLLPMLRARTIEQLFEATRGF